MHDLHDFRVPEEFFVCVLASLMQQGDGGNRVLPLERPNDPAFEGPNACVQRRRSEAQGTNPAGVGVRWNAQLGWWQYKDCEASKPAHEATAWCARCAELAAPDASFAMPPPLRMASAIR